MVDNRRTGMEGRSNAFMSERTIDEFKAAIQYCPDEEAEIDKYLTLKGPDRYFEILDTYRKESKKSKPS